MRPGFSLIEILVTITVALVIMGGGIASFIRFNERQTLLGAAQELQTYLRSAQTKARVGDRPVDCQRLEAYQVTMIQGSSQVEISAVCDDGQLFLQRQEDLPSAVTATNPVTVEFLVLHGGVSQAADINLVSGSGSSYEFNVTQGGEITQGQLVDESQINQPQASPTPSPSPDGQIMTSPSPSPSPSQPATAVILNQASGNSCTQICQGQGYTSCQSVGVDTGATNAKLWTGFFGSCTKLSAGCGTSMNPVQTSCSGYTARWTNCKCQR